MGAGGKDGCTSCITRTPYATLIALIMCWAGVGVFCGTMYRCRVGLGDGYRVYTTYHISEG